MKLSIPVIENIMYYLQNHEYDKLIEAVPEFDIYEGCCEYRDIIDVFLVKYDNINCIEFYKIITCEEDIKYVINEDNIKSGCAHETDTENINKWDVMKSYEEFGLNKRNVFSKITINRKLNNIISEKIYENFEDFYRNFKTLTTYINKCCNLVLYISCENITQSCDSLFYNMVGSTYIKLKCKKKYPYILIPYDIREL